MNCHQAQRNILLEASGEISRFAAGRLRRHLAHCEACRRQADWLRTTTLAVRESSEAIPPLSDFDREQILAFARRQQTREERPHRRMQESFIVTWRPALLYASLGILLLTGFLLITRPLMKQPQLAHKPAAESTTVAWDDDFDTRYSEVGSIMASATYGTTEITDTADTDSLAQELLKMEGSAI